MAKDFPPSININYQNYHNTHGWTQMSEPSGVSKLQVSLKVPNDQNLPPDYIKTELCRLITNEIIKTNNVTFNTYHHNDSFGMEKVYVANVTVAEPSVKYVNMTFDGFKVKDRVFTNEELVEAVEHHFVEDLL